MSEAIAAASDLGAVTVPREVWSKSSRPFRGLLFRFTLGLTFVLVGLTLPQIAAKIGLTVVGLAVFAAIPWFADGRFEALRTELLATPRAKANGLLGGLEDRRMVAMLAPCGWVSLVKGELHLKLGDGRAASRAFAEAARQCGDLKMPALAGAQAHALTIAGDRKEARALLVDLEERDALSARDRLNLGMIYLEDPSKGKTALRHLEAAAESLGTHPRTQAALAFALAKNGKIEEASASLEALADRDDVSDDVLAPELIKRAKKTLRQSDDVQDKRPRKSPKRKAATSEPAASAATPTETPAASPQKEKSLRKQKRERKKERRERRKARGAKSGPVKTIEPAKAAPPKPTAPATDTRAAEAAESEKRAAEQAQREAEAAAKKAAATAAAEALKKKAKETAAAAAAKKKAEQEAEEKAKPKPPAISFEGPDNKPVFAAPGASKPAVPKPPSSKPAAPKIAIPTIEVAAPPKVGAPPKVAPPPIVSTAKPGAPAPPKIDEGWDDLFGDD